jgi:hypothetical protein
MFFIKNNDHNYWLNPITQMYDWLKTKTKNQKAALDVAICFYQNFLVSFDILFNSKNEPKTVLFKCLKIVSEVGKVAKCMPYLQCFHVQRHLFYIS